MIARAAFRTLKHAQSTHSQNSSEHCDFIMSVCTLLIPIVSRSISNSTSDHRFDPADGAAPLAVSVGTLAANLGHQIVGTQKRVVFFQTTLHRSFSLNDFYSPPGTPLIVNSCMTTEEATPVCRIITSSWARNLQRGTTIRTEGESLSGSEQMAVHHPVNADTGRIP